MLLYIHIPFCDSKCFYCSFNSYTDSFHLKKTYMQVLIKELKNKISKYEIINFDTIFFGGGTPSSLHISYYQDIFQALSSKITPNTEITFEANPNSATKEWLKEIRNFGTTRISFGVQSFDDEKLKYLGRSHDKQKAIDALTYANDIGFDSINCDILYNTKCDTKELILNDLNIINSLNIKHLSAYSLTIEENTKFYDNKTTEIFDEDFSIFVIDSIKQNGFLQYEISNFAKENKYISKHNLGYWQKKDYIGIGAGAVGCIKDVRYSNEKDLYKYIRYQNSDLEYLSDYDNKLEIIFLGLRSCVGFDIDILTKNQRQRLQILLDENKLRMVGNIVFNDNYLLSDELVLFITQ